VPRRVSATLARPFHQPLGGWPVKKGRHRRFEEARALKRTSDNLDSYFGPEQTEPCAECGAVPGADHASWCLAGQADDGDDDAGSDSW